MTCIRRKDGKTIRQWCLENNVPYGSVWNNVDKGMDVDEACQHSLERRGKKNNSKYIYQGKTVSSILGNTSSAYQTFARRIRKGMTVEEAMKGLI